MPTADSRHDLRSVGPGQRAVRRGAAAAGAGARGLAGSPWRRHHPGRRHGAAADLRQRSRVRSLRCRQRHHRRHPGPGTDRPAPRRLPAGGGNRPRRHGHRLRGGARRRRVRPAGGDQDPARVERGPGRRAVPLRAARARRPRSPGHRQAAGCRQHRRRHALPGHGAGRRPAHRRVVRGARDRCPRACRPGGKGVHRPGVCASASGRAPRRQGGQHPGHCRRRAQAARLRHRHAARHRWRGDDGPDPDGASQLHAGIRQPRADPRRAGHHRLGRLLARRRALPAARAAARPT